MSMKRIITNKAAGPPYPVDVLRLRAHGHSRSCDVTPCTSSPVQMWVASPARHT